MLERHPTYKGCYVCKRWLILSNFVEDVTKIDGYDENKFLNGELDLDKDIKSDNQNKCYSLEQCMLVSRTENSKQMIKHHDYSNEERNQKISKALMGKNSYRAIKVTQYNKQLIFVKTYDCIMDAERETGIAHQSISKCCRGKLNSAGGYIWRYVEEG